LACFFKQTGLTTEQLRRDERERAQSKREIKQWFDQVYCSSASVCMNAPI
jgi:NAD+--asparagine ADP-ribosyltransferase